MSTAKSPTVKYTAVQKSVIVKVGRKTYTLLVADKDQKAKIKTLVESINKSYTDHKVDRLIKMLTPKQEKKKEIAKVEKKVIKKKLKVVKQQGVIEEKVATGIEKVIDTVSQFATDQALAQVKKVEDSKPAATSGMRRSGEY